MSDLSDPIIVVRATLVSGYGGQLVRDWANATRTPGFGDVQPFRTEEFTDRQQATITRWHLFVEPPFTDLEATDRVEWNGETLKVEGDVETWSRGGVVEYRHAVLARVVEEA